MKLFHFTPPKNVKKILKEGIKPRGSGPANFGAGMGFDSNPAMIYLTSDQDFELDDNATALEVEITDTGNLYPDEDCI